MMTDNNNDENIDNPIFSPNENNIPISGIDVHKRQFDNENDNDDEREEDLEIVEKSEAKKRERQKLKDLLNQKSDEYFVLLLYNQNEYKDVLLKMMSEKNSMIKSVKYQANKEIVNQFYNNMLAESYMFCKVADPVRNNEEIESDVELLTFISALFVPGTFITSIFSMNVTIPWQNSNNTSYVPFIVVNCFIFAIFILFTIYYVVSNRIAKRKSKRR